ncbi:MAG: hypothetical protein KJ971_08235 [Firmicutes bacterium]|nr:hypothetical protein [Bacillota bacterium]
MVRIVTGKINSFKTTKMIELYKKIQKGDGFVSLKIMIKDKVHSYNALHLLTNETFPLIIRKEFNDSSKEVICQIGEYHFLKDTVLLIENTIEKMIKAKVSPIFLDEIGNLELQEKGFHQILKKMISSKLDLYLSIRADLVDEIIKKYNIEEFEIISLS